MSDASSLRERFADGIRVGDWLVEPMLNRVQHEDETIQLEPKVMEVLLCMARRPGKTITKDQFKDNVWTDTVVTDDVLSRCISQLRKVFDDDPKDPSYIETIRKTGYRLVAPVEHVDASAPASSSAEEGALVPEEEDSQPLLRRLMQRVAGAVSVPSADGEDEWSVEAGEAVRRNWLLTLGSVLGIVLVLALLLWQTPGSGSNSDAPISAMPFTSFPGEEFDPALSSRGHQVAFAWRQPDSLDQNIYLMQRGAEQPLRLSPDSTLDWSPTWSPDGRFIAYVQSVNGARRVSIVPSIGGQDREVVHLEQRDVESVEWMPDTSRRALVLAAEQQPHQAYSLSTISVDADSVRSLTDPPLWSIGDTSPTPSPDGSQIAFTRGTVQGVENVFVVPASGGTATQVTTDSTDIDGLAWSADGSEILYAAQRSGLSGIWRVDADGGDPTLVRSASEGTRFSQPSVSPESNRLAYTQHSAQLDVWALQRPSQYDAYTPTPLLSSTQEDTNPSISPDGEQIAFVSDRSGTREVWMARADGSKATRLTAPGGPAVQAVTWSPNGNRLCFVAREHGQSDLYLISASGGTASRLTTARSEDLVPRWSRDGRWVYFSSNRTGHWEVWRSRASADTQRVHRVTSGGAVAAQESATDSTLYLVRPDTTGIWAVDLDTTRFPLPVGPDTQRTPPDSLLAFADASGEMAAPSAGTTKEASSLRQVVEGVLPRERSNWWVEESGIFFIHRESNRAVLARFEFAPDRITPLYEFPDWRPIQSMAVGPRGEWFVYTHVVRRESDIMLVEEFQ